MSLFIGIFFGIKEGFLNGILGSGFKENNESCVASNSNESRVVYTDRSGEWVSDLSGKNIQRLFEDQLYLDAHHISPDDQKVSTIRNEHLWIHCVNSEGVYKIQLPKFEKDNGYYESRSFPSWSPDSNYMILNNGGDLLLVDLQNKKTSILIENVAIVNNHVNLNDKSRDTMVSPYEFGDAYWSPSGIIFYTSFKDGKALLKNFDIKSGDDKVLYESSFKINIVSGSPMGDVLYLIESEWIVKAVKKPLTAHFKRYLYDVKSGSKSELTTPINNDLVWSKSGKYIAESQGSYMVEPFTAFPAEITELSSGEKKNITKTILNDFLKRKLISNEEILTIQVIDFIDDDNILFFAQIIGKGHNSKSISGKFNLKEQEAYLFPQSGLVNGINSRRPIKLIN